MRAETNRLSLQPVTRLSFQPSLTDLRFVEVPDDHLEPTLQRGDFVLLATVETFSGDGVYLVRDALGGVASFRVDAELRPGAPGVRLWCENERYAARHVSAARFAEVVVGKAVMSCHIIDSRLHHHPFAA